MQNEPMQRCDNCLKEFPQSKIGTHFGYCRRNIKRCTVCRQMYDINFQQEHEEEYHKQEKQENCPHCKRSFSSSEYTRHEANCSLKPKYCEYCQLNVPVSTYPSHLKECESRTKPCTKCNKPITNKEYLIHLVSCPGPQEDHPLPRNYQQHIQEQRTKVAEHYKPSNNSRDKPSYVHQPYKPREQKQYAPISHDKPSQGIRHQVPPRQEEKKQIKYPSRVEPKREEPKREEPRRYPGTINPPSSTVTYKREDVRGQNGNKIITNSSANQPISHGNYDPKRQVPSNRDIKPSSNYPSHQPVSNKDLFGKQGPSIQSSKSIERQGQPPKREERQPIKRQEKPPTRDPYSNPSNRVKAPQTKQRVIYQSETPQPRQSADFLQEEYALGSLDLGAQDHELQMAIMQSMGQKPKAQGGQGRSGNTSYAFESEWNNPSFLAEQQAIEEQLRKQNKRR